MAFSEKLSQHQQLISDKYAVITCSLFQASYLFETVKGRKLTFKDDEKGKKQKAALSGRIMIYFNNGDTFYVNEVNDTSISNKTIIDLGNFLKLFYSEYDRLLDFAAKRDAKIIIDGAELTAEKLKELTENLNIL